MYCKRCKKLYKIGNLGLCHDCVRELEDILAKIKEYLHENTGANIAELCRELNLNERDVSYLIKIGRLDLNKPDDDAILTCKKCGRPINSGLYCSSCAQRLEKLFNKTVKEMDPENKYQTRETEQAESNDHETDSNTLGLYWRSRGKRL